MREQDVFVLADRTLNDVVARVRPEQWDKRLPEEFQRHDRQGAPTVREVLNYHAYDDAWVPDMLAGKTMDEVGPGTYDGDLLGEDPAGNFAALVERACAAASAVSDLSLAVHTSFGDFSAREYFWQVNYFRGLRAHDLSRVLELGVELPDDLVRGLWEELSPKAEEWRSYGVFPAAVPVPDDAPLLDRLLGLTGRQPLSTAG